MASQGLRCVAMGFRELDMKDAPAARYLDWVIPRGSMTLLAIVGIQNRWRPEVPATIRQLKEAGIRVKMMTGKAIATECGILGDAGSIAIEGSVFRDYSDETRRQEAPRIAVMARSTPSDKLLMVQTLKKLGEVVAVIGDDVSDAYALGEADVGVAMGIELGTEVARQNSDIILSDDNNFAAVVGAVKWGRLLYINTQNFIQFQFTESVATLFIYTVAAVASDNVLPLTAVQMLWINSVTNILGSFALATQTPTNDQDLLDYRPPAAAARRNYMRFVSRLMWTNILFQSAFQILVVLVLHFYGRSLMGNNNNNTNLVFNALVFCQVFNMVNCRKVHSWNVWRGLLEKKNGMFLGILGFTMVLQVMVVEFASKVKLHWRYWALSIGIGFMSWPIGLIAKFKAK